MNAHLPNHPRSTNGRRRTRRWSSAAASVLSVATLLALTAAAPMAARASGDVAAMSERRAASEYPGQWRWPVGAPIRVVSPFRAPPTPYQAGHRGIDVAAEAEAPVFAAAGGVVSYAGMVAGRPVVAIDHGDGVVSAIEPVETLVAAGTAVAAGDPIGIVSTGGHCASGCVHFGVRVDGEYVSPFLFLGGLPRAVLLPLP